jgi:Flp pilus assembly protein TadG
VTALRRVARRLARDESGSLAPAVPIVAIMFLILAGLVIDSSRELTARARAVSYAQEAARAGASAVDPASEPLVLLPGEAKNQAEDYCAAAEASEPELTCHAPTATLHKVTVTTEIEIPSGLLGLVRIKTLHATGVGTAHPLIGTTQGDAHD